MYDKKKFTNTNKDKIFADQDCAPIDVEQQVIEQNIFNSLIAINHENLNISNLSNQALALLRLHPLFSVSPSVIWEEKDTVFKVIAKLDLQCMIDRSLYPMAPNQHFSKNSGVEIQWNDDASNNKFGAKNRLDIFLTHFKKNIFCISLWCNASQQTIAAAHPFLHNYFGVFNLLAEKSELKMREKLLNKVMEVTVDSIEITDQNAIIQYINPAFETITQYRADEAIGYSVASLLRQEDASPVFFNQINTELSQGRTWTGTIHSKKKDGSLWMAQTTVVPFSDEDGGEITHHIAIKQDISKHLEQAQQLKINEERYKNIMNAASDAIFVNDINGSVLEANAAACDSLGYTLQELKAIPIWEIEVGVTVEKMNQLWDNLPTEPLTLEGVHKRKDGSTFPVEVRIGVFNSVYQNLIIAIARDITERKRAENEIKQFARAIEQSPVLVMITDRFGIIEYTSDKLTELTGYKPEEIIGKNSNILKSGLTGKETYQELWRTLHSGQEWRGELLNKNKNGDLFWISAIISPLKNDDHVPTHFLAIIEDITQQRSYKEILKHQATYDKMTNLPNRITGYNKLEQSIAIADQKQSKLALLFIDLDNFKPINDSLGHDAGDQLLKAFATRLMSTVRHNDTIARLGGDEFMIILDNIKQPQNATHIVEKCLAVTKKPFHIDSHQVNITASIGIAIYPDHGSHAKQLMKHADKAMYHSKSLGKNNWSLYDASMSNMAQKDKSLKSELRKAFENNEFNLHYHPVIDVEKNKTIGAEALLRCTNLKLAVISPLQLITLAEETDFIMPLGEWILFTACEQAKLWEKTTGEKLKIFINISIQQLKDPDFIPQVKKALKDSNLSPEQLVLEISESAFIDESLQIRDQFLALSEMNIDCAIDDFCMGYSSLHSLQAYPFKSLKLDKSFIQSSHINQSDYSLLQSIITLSRQLKLQVVAEGIETLDHLKLVQSLNCDLAQGWYFSKALNKHQFLNWLQDSKH